jgi:hypothetical protein
VKVNPMKTHQEYADILSELSGASSSPDIEIIDTNLKEVVIGAVIPSVMQQVSEGSSFDPLETNPNELLRAATLLPITFGTAMFQLGVLFGRREASELLE